MSWVRRVFARGRVYGDLSAEIREHLEEKIEELMAEGMPRKQAEAKARKEFGNVTLMEERGREVWQWPRLESFIADVRYGMRMLRKSPGFTAVAVLTLALGIGANTAIFSAVNGILLRRLPYSQASRLVTIQRAQSGWELSALELSQIRGQCTAVGPIVRYENDAGLLTMGVAAEQIQIDRVPSDLFSLLGVAPILGRPILPQDMQPGNDHVAILSYKLWMDDFGGDTHIVGRKITIDQKSYIVIGVMPAEFGLGIFYHSFELEFGLPGSGRIWEPVLPSQEVHQTTVAAGKLVARLKDGATLAQLNAQLRPLSERFAADFPPGSTGVSIFAQRLNPGIPSSVSVPLIILFAAVGFVLLMACVNVASLLVGRSWSRQRELTIRRTLGATRFRIVRQLLCESLLLAIAGGALGLFFSIWGIRVLRAVAPPYSPRVEYIRLDANVLWFTLAASLLTAILIGLTPALHATSRRVGAKLKGGLSGSFAETTMRQSRVFRSSLVVLELALAMIVVVGGALMARSFYRLMILNAVVRPSHVVTMQVRYSDSPCSDRKSVTACVTLFALDAIARIRSLPGIQQAALASCGGPFTGGRQIGHYPGSGRVGLYIEGLTGDQLPSAGLFMLDVGSITPGYFASLGVPIVKGRDFNWGDLAGPPAVIVSESFARKYISGNPVGQHISTLEDGAGHSHWEEVVGVVRDIRDRAVAPSDQGPSFYEPFQMQCDAVQVIARTTGSPQPLISPIELAARSVDKSAQIGHIETVDQLLAQSAAAPRFQTVLLGSFGLLGLILAMIGIYGVISYSVVQRTHEIGVRMAMGAGRGDVLRMILGEGLLLAFIGIAIGVAGALALTRFLRSLLFEIKPTDPVTYIGVAMLMAFVALAACWIPARRAMKVDPMVALRYE